MQMQQRKRGPYSIFQRFNRMSLALLLLIAFGLLLVINLEMRRHALAETHALATQQLAHYQTLHQGLATAPLASPSSPHVLAREWGHSDLPVREVHLRASDPQQQVDPFEQALLQHLTQHPSTDSFASIRRLEGAHFYTVMRQGLTFQTACQQCHQPSADEAENAAPPLPGYALGDPVTLLILHAPLAESYQRTQTLSLRLTLLVFAALGLLFMIQRILVAKYLAAPLHELRRRCHLPPTQPLPIPRELELVEITTALNRQAAATDAEESATEKEVPQTKKGEREEPRG